MDKVFPQLDEACKGRDTFETDEAARFLNRKSQTLRRWACYENAPLKPIRIHGRLAWRVSDIKRLLGGEK